MSRFVGLILSVPIAADILGKRAVSEDADTGVGVNPNVAKAKCLGITVEDIKAAAGFAAVQVSGVAEAVFGGAVKINDSLTTDNQGRLVKAAGAAGDHVWCVGFSRSVIAQAGDEGEVLIHPHQVVI